MATYTAEQLGPIEIRPVSRKTKPMSVALLVVHEDGDQTTIAMPLSGGARAGRVRTLQLISAEIDINDIRIVIIPDGTVGGDDALDGQTLRPVSDALWWTTDDARRCGDRPVAEYAQELLARKYAEQP